jgi:putative oxidoreductase
MLSLLQGIERVWSKLPEDIGLLLARFTLATIFWRSGQTKIEGFQLDLIDMKFQWGWPVMAESTLFLFEYEYNLPLLSPGFAALLATLAEHFLPLLLLLGFLTRSSALMLLVMTLVIQIFVYPDAWVTHGLWGALLLVLISRGAGRLSLDALMQR